MAKTIEQLKAQGAEIKNATVVGENTATRVGTLFTDIVEHVEKYETANTEANTLAISNEAQARAKADEQLNTAIEAEKNRAKDAEQVLQDKVLSFAELYSLATIQGYIANDGILIENFSYVCTPFIEIVAGAPIFIQGATSGTKCCIAFYDENKIFISGVADLHYDNVFFQPNIPDNTKYIRASFTRKGGRLVTNVTNYFNNEFTRVNSKLNFVSGYIDSVSDSIEYVGSGWTFDTSGLTDDYMGTNAASINSGDFMRVFFFGTGVSIYHRGGPSRGIVEVFIDGASYGTFDAYMASTEFRSLLTSIHGLTQRVHELKIVNTGIKNSSAKDILFVFDYLSVDNIVMKSIGKDKMLANYSFISKEYNRVNSTHYNYYVIKNYGFKKIRVKTESDITDNVPVIALFNDTVVAQKNLITDVIADSDTLKSYELEVPNDCKLILCQVRATDNIDNESSSIELFCDKNIEVEELDDSGFMSIVHLDCGRKYFSLTNIKKMIDTLVEAHCNCLQLYFSDNQGFRFGLDDMSINANNQVYDLSVSLGDGISTTSGDVTKSPDGSNKWLTQDEMSSLIHYAKSKGIEIIPAFDMPSHMGCILKDFNQFKYQGSNVDIDLKNGEAVNFCLALIDKYCQFFGSQGCKYYNFGGDEVTYLNYLVNNDELHYYNDFIDKASRIIMGYGLTPIAFNEAICYNNQITGKENTDIISMYWSYKNNYPKVCTQASIGIDLINTSASLYWVLGMYGSSIKQINNFDYTRFYPNQYHFNPKGACFCIWCDKADTDGADNGDKVVADTKQLIIVFGNTIKRRRMSLNGVG